MVTRFLTTATHHNLHHEVGHAHFVIYFTWWDKVMDTEHPDYHGTFEAAVRVQPTVSEALSIAVSQKSERADSAPSTDTPK